MTRQHVFVELTLKPESEGPFSRWFWRIAQRYGRDWQYTTDHVVRRELRMMSWRRAL